MFCFLNAKTETRVSCRKPLKTLMVVSCLESRLVCVCVKIRLPPPPQKKNHAKFTHLFRPKMVLLLVLDCCSHNHLSLARDGIFGFHVPTITIILHCGRSTYLIHCKYLNAMHLEESPTLEGFQAYIGHVLTKCLDQKES